MVASKTLGRKGPIGPAENGLLNTEHEERACVVGSRLAMEVQCDSCKTEYEFDDALVSVRGTRVRCTHCGHQFTVRRSEATERTDEWVILTSKGDELRFGALRDLQRAILDGRFDGRLRAAQRGLYDVISAPLSLRGDS